MDQNLNNERIVGFLGQSYVLIPRKVLEMLFRGEGRERSVGMVFTPLKMSIFSSSLAMASAWWGGSWAPSDQ